MSIESCDISIKRDSVKQETIISIANKKKPKLGETVFGLSSAILSRICSEINVETEVGLMNSLPLVIDWLENYCKVNRVKESEIIKVYNDEEVRVN